MKDWFTFTPQEPPSAEKVEDLVRGKLARRIQQRVRGVVDHGLSRDAALTAGSVVAEAEGGRIVIRSDDSAEVLRQSTAAAFGKPASDETENPDDLFETSTGIPKLVSDGSGERLMFRAISAEAIMRRQAAGQRDQNVEKAVRDSISTGIVDDYDEAIKDVSRGK